MDKEALGDMWQWFLHADCPSVTHNSVKALTQTQNNKADKRK